MDLLIKLIGLGAGLYAFYSVYRPELVNKAKLAKVRVRS